MYYILFILSIIIFILSIVISINSFDKFENISISTDIYSKLSNKLKSAIETVFKNCKFQVLNSFNNDIVIFIKDIAKYIGIGFIKNDPKEYVENFAINFKFLPNKKYWLIHSICIIPEFRGKKICSNLLIPYVIKLAKKYTIDYILLEVDKDNITAQKCYTNNNFYIIDEYLLKNIQPRYLLSYKV